MSGRVVEFTARFHSDYKKLDPQTQGAVDDALASLQHTPFPKALRHHTLNGFKPKIHVVDVNAQHTHQITFHLDGSNVRLLRIGTHKQIDRSPA